MDTKEIATRKRALQRLMEAEIKRFMEETGCRPQIEIEYHHVNRINGPPEVLIPQVSIQVIL